MEEAENRLPAPGSPKIRLQIRRTNTGVADFYRRLGFSTGEIMGTGKRIEQDAPG